MYLEATQINYYALTVTILAKCSVETAFEKLQADHPDSIQHSITKNDVAIMRRLKEQGMSYPEIAAMYGVPWTTVYGRLRSRNRKAVAECSASAG